MNMSVDCIDSGFGEKASGRDLQWKLGSPQLTEELTAQVMAELDMYFSTRCLTYLPGQRELIKRCVSDILSFKTDKPAAVALLPGTGKSTLIRALLKVLARQFVSGTEYAQKLGGAIIVVEKTAEAYYLRELIDKIHPNLVHVVESPNDFNISHGKCARPEVRGYADCPGTACPNAPECLLLQASGRTEHTPFLIVLHARYARFVDQMDRFRDWFDGTVVRRRSLLIIDEAPPLLRENELAFGDIAEFEVMLSRLKPSYRQSDDWKKQDAIRAVEEYLQRPFRQLMWHCRSTFGKAGPVNRTMMESAGLSEENFPNLAARVSGYAGEAADEFLERVRAQCSCQNVFAVGNELSLRSPTLIPFDEKDGLSTYILSGSAELSPELCDNPSIRLIPDTVEESYARLCFCIQRTDIFGATKAAMEREGNQKALVAWLRARLAALPPDEKALVVTYKAFAAPLWAELKEYHDRLIPKQADDDGKPESMLPYFGGMNGSNKYTDATCVICAGLGRFEAGDYLNRALAYDFDGTAWAELQQASAKNPKLDIRELECVQSMQNRTLARDLVQLVFRSALRHHGGTVPITVWLLQPPNEVVSLLADFFGDCHIIEETEVPAECLLEQGAHKTVNGKPTHAARLLRWLRAWDGSPILFQDVRRQLNMTAAQWKEARKNALVRVFITEHVVMTRFGRETQIMKPSCFRDERDDKNIS